MEVVVDSVSFRCNNKVIVDNVSFCVRSGITCVIESVVVVSLHF